MRWFPYVIIPIGFSIITSIETKSTIRKEPKISSNISFKTSLVFVNCLISITAAEMDSRSDEKHNDSTMNVEEEGKKEPLMITDKPETSKTTNEEGPKTLSVGGGSVTLDHLGPMVINTDGTISRISNWANLSDIERNRTLRLVAQRNSVRVSRLKSKEEEEDKQRKKLEREEGGSSESSKIDDEKSNENKKDEL